jgi:hypothetical protein
MNKPKHNCLLVLLGLTFLFSNSTMAVVHTCTSSGVEYETYLPGYVEAGFDVINSQCETLIKENWNSFNMQKELWLGWGFYNLCNKYTPANRTLRALELLRISKNPAVKKDAILNKAYEYSKFWIHRLSPICFENKPDNNSKAGFHISREALENEANKEKLSKELGEDLGEDLTEKLIREMTEELINSSDPGTGSVFLTQNLFNKPIISIATIILHEARHKKKRHNGASGCPRKRSCDTNFEYYGANAIMLHYSWWYGLASKNSTQFTRQMGLDFSREIQDNFFNIRPTFHIPIIAK